MIKLENAFNFFVLCLLEKVKHVLLAWALSGFEPLSASRFIFFFAKS